MPCDSVAIARATVKADIADVLGNAQALGGLVSFLAKMFGTATLTSQDVGGRMTIEVGSATEGSAYVHIWPDGQVRVRGAAFNRNQRFMDRITQQTTEYLEAAAPLATRERMVGAVKAKGRLQSDVTDRKTGVRVLTLTV